MNKLLLFLVILVFMGVGSLFFLGGAEKPTAQPVAAREKPPEAPALTEADRDTYANTIRTMNARNNELMRRLEEMEKRVAEDDRKTPADSREVRNLIDQSVEERAKRLTSTFTAKLDQMRSELSAKTRRAGNQTQRETQTGRTTDQENGIPEGLGFDDLPFEMPGILAGKNKNRPGMVPAAIGTGVTIMPVTMIETAGKGENSYPLAIDGTPLDPEAADPQLARRSTKSKTKQKEPDPPVPFYTIPQNATLFSNDTMTALVGIVPVQNSVIDPIRFKVITGSSNMATNGLYLPAGIRDIVWSGIAIGNREMSCIRGELHSVTFTFEDGTIQTINSQQDKGKDRLGGKLLGYIATSQGNPCLPGKLITNAQDYLKDRMIASGIAAAASGFAETQQSTVSNSDGSLTQYFNGDSADYITSKTLEGSLTEMTEYLRERQRNAVDLVYLNAGQDVVIHVETELPIDYDPNGRKLDHAQKNPALVSYRLD